MSKRHVPERSQVTYEEAEEAKDYLAGKLVDGDSVLSVGMRMINDKWGVGITWTKRVDIPALPEHLQHVVVSVRRTWGSAQAQSWQSLPTPLDLAEEERNPTVSILVTKGGEFVRYIRRDELERMKKLSKVLLDDDGFWRMTSG